MFSFDFSNKKTVSKDSSPYPILLADVKAKSLYFAENPTDDSYDAYINNVIIPNVVSNWESSTKFLLLDQTISAFVPSISSINSHKLEVNFTNLNIREILGVYYYPDTWDEDEAKTELDDTHYLISEEIGRDPSALSLKQDHHFLSFFSRKNNLEARYKAGYLNNDFSAMASDIKDALSMQASVILDVKNGYCEDYYSNMVKDIYTKYTIISPQITFI